MNGTANAKGEITHAEILQQPKLWPTTLEIVSQQVPVLVGLRAPLISGAGTSAYAASAIAGSWRRARAVPTTDLILDAKSYCQGANCLLSIARSGDSPESVGVVRIVQKEFPEMRQFAITCNAAGALAQSKGVNAIILDPRTNDRSLVMTSSFSNLTLAGMCLNHTATLRAELPQIAKEVELQMGNFEEQAREIAQQGVSRLVALGSGPLFSMAREAALKVLEMTGGRCVSMAETYLGLRHGPLSFLRADTLVLCFLSSDERQRSYEEDLIQELRRKQLGRIVAIAPKYMADAAEVRLVPACAPSLPDYLRTPFEIVFPQLLAYQLSLQAGLNPDNPSPDGIITRVVQGVRIHEN